MRLLVVTLVACRPVLAPPTKPIPIAIVTPIPGVEKRTCMLMEPPVPPPDIELNHDNDDILTRTTVNYVQHNQLLQWARDAQGWMDEMRQCILHLTGDE